MTLHLRGSFLTNLPQLPLKFLTITIFAVSSHLYSPPTFANNEDLVEYPKNLMKLLKTFDAASVKSVDEAMPYLVKELGAGATLASHSQSGQSEKRLLLFGKTGELIVGVGADDDELHVVEDPGPGKDLINFKISFRSAGPGKKKYKVTTKPRECASCHTQNFRYIWGSYSRGWKHYHGAHDDQQDPNDPDWLALKKEPRFKPYFAGHEKDESFPYYKRDAKKYFLADEPNRIIGRMPNTRLAMIIVRRAAKSLAFRLRNNDPTKYNRWKYYLMRLLLQCNDVLETEVDGKMKQSPESAVFDSEFKKDNPEAFRRWSSIIRGIDPDNKNARNEAVGVMRLIHYLGVKPDGIVLLEESDGVDPLSSPKKYQESIIEPFDGGSPIAERLGNGGYDGGNAFGLRHFLINFIADDVGGDLLKMHQKVLPMEKAVASTKLSGSRTYDGGQDSFDPIGLDAIAMGAEWDD